MSSLHCSFNGVRVKAEVNATSYASGHGFILTCLTPAFNAEASVSFSVNWGSDSDPHQIPLSQPTLDNSVEGNAEVPLIFTYSDSCSHHGCGLTTVGGISIPLQCSKCGFCANTSGVAKIHNAYTGEDCTGTCYGTAKIDSCNICSGGTR